MKKSQTVIFLGHLKQFMRRRSVTVRSDGESRKASGSIAVGRNSGCWTYKSPNPPMSTFFIALCSHCDILDMVEWRAQLNVTRDFSAGPRDPFYGLVFLFVRSSLFMAGANKKLVRVRRLSSSCFSSSPYVSCLVRLSIFLPFFPERYVIELIEIPIQPHHFFFVIRLPEKGANN